MSLFPDTQTIEAWLTGKLPESEAQALEERERTDAGFASLVDRHRLGYEVLEAGLGLHLKERLQALAPSASSLPTPTKASIRPFWQRATVWSVAAAVVLLIAASLRMAYTHTDQAIARQFAEAYAAPPVRGELGPEELVNQGLEAYQDERYEAAIDAFSQLPADHPRYIEMRFYLGNCALQLGHAPQAIQEFQLVLDQKDIRFAPAAEWYQALAYLQDGQVQQAEQIARRLAEDEESAYRGQAKRLLEKLGSGWR